VPQVISTISQRRGRVDVAFGVVRRPCKLSLAGGCGHCGASISSANSNRYCCVETPLRDRRDLGQAKSRPIPPGNYSCVLPGSRYRPSFLRLATYSKISMALLYAGAELRHWHFRRYCCHCRRRSHCRLCCWPEHRSFSRVGRP
jgi:hypothetical protein